jgi:hypothetical protein
VYGRSQRTSCNTTKKLQPFKEIVDDHQPPCPLPSNFNYRELLLPVAKASVSIDAAASLPTAIGVKSSMNKGNRAAKQTPPELLVKLSYAKAGETLVVENALGLFLEYAKPIIANMLSNQRRNQAMGEAVGKLRKTATITYTDSSLQPQ